MNHLYSKDKVTRQELSDAVADLTDKYNHFLLDMVMRTGKSAVASALCKKWKGNILILSAAESTNKQWLENLNKYSPELVERLDIYCYHSLHKLDRNKYSIILLDEFELALSDKRLEQIKEFKPSHWVAMSGTLSYDDINAFRSLTKNNFYKAKVSLEQAVDWQLIPKPKIICVPLQFDDTRPYLIYHKGKDKRKENVVVPFINWAKHSRAEYNLQIKCTEKEYLILINEEVEYWGKRYQDALDKGDYKLADIFKLKWIKTGGDRKKFFARLKTQHFFKLYKVIKDKRALVFCNDTEQANLINKELSIHSKSENSLELIEKFNNKEINMLVSVKMLDRGIDFNSVDYAIILQQSGKQNSPQQQAGRTYLSSNPRIVTFYYPGTQDEKYLKNFLKSFKEDWIEYKNLPT